MGKQGNFDKRIERLTRLTAQKMSRRSFVSTLGIVFAGAAAVPLLPVNRKAHAEAVNTVAQMTAFAKNAQTMDDTQCNYWRYCSSDGYLCSCCGGGPSTCPPGTSASPTSWIGSCVNPDDGKTYLMAYRDCCGTEACGRCNCLAVDGESPVYRPQLNNDIIWCFGSTSQVYHCSSAAIVGLAE